jgi:Protein of unknown function (DUF2971)
MTNPARLHDKSHFFKFASIDSAIKIINSKKFIWSSPVNFNDPFDTQTGFTLNYDEVTFAEMLSESILRVIYSDSPVKIDTSTLFAALLMCMREIKHQIPKEKVIEKTYSDALESAKNLPNTIAQLNAKILEHHLHSRVFCVSEFVDNVVMWSHYADKHQGVAFKLGCIDSIDNLLLRAQKVDYVNKFLTFPDAQQYACHLTGEKTIDMGKLFDKLVYIKHIDWGYENEWRVHVPMLDKPAGNGVDLYKENADIFEAMYLGCNMNKENAFNIIALARKELPNMKIFKAVRSNKSYELTFEHIG